MDRLGAGDVTHDVGVDRPGDAIAVDDNGAASLAPVRVRVSYRGQLHRSLQVLNGGRLVLRIPGQRDSEAIGLVPDHEGKHRLGEVAPPPRDRAERRGRDAVGFDRVGLAD